MSRLRLCSYSTFYLCSLLAGFADGYRKDGEQWVYSWRGPDSEHSLTVAEADSPSFRVLTEPEYAADKHAVYWRGAKIPDADPVSFKQIREEYWADAVSVYFYAEKIPKADPKSFIPLAIKSWSKDKDRCFHGTSEVPAAVPETFAGINYGWARDGQHYYVSTWKKVVVVKCDYDSMTVLNVNYAKDKSRVYYREKEVTGADVKSFRVVSNVTAMDGSKTYMSNRAVVFVSEPSQIPLKPILEKFGPPTKKSTDDGIDSFQWESEHLEIKVDSEAQFIRILSIRAGGEKAPVTYEKALGRVIELYPGWQWKAQKPDGALEGDVWRQYRSQDEKITCSILLDGSENAYGYEIILRDSTINMPKHWQDEQALPR